MSLFNGFISITGSPSFLLFSIFVVAFLGFLLGRIKIKGVSLGIAGVFIIALLFGAFFSNPIKATLGDGYSSYYKIVENIGLMLFVGAVGLIAGPNFFKNLKKNFKSYILLGVVIIFSGAIACAICFYIGRNNADSDLEFIAMLVGLLTGALTSTPAFSAAKATVATVAETTAMAEELETIVTVGHGIAYLFGVIGVVLFVQLVPKIMKVDMEEERKKITIVDTGKANKKTGRINIDSFGFCVFAFVILAGIFVGSIKIPLTSAGISGTTFSLTSTGGILLVGLVVGHFGHIGDISLKISKSTLEAFREFGLMLFLAGAGIPGGINFVQYFKAVYFLYGAFMTVLPMVIGFVVAKFVLKLPLLNNLGSITGGMTSTPALGTLINVAGTDDVASAYAATYPVALIAVVLASQFLILIFGG